MEREEPGTRKFWGLIRWCGYQLASGRHKGGESPPALGSRQEALALPCLGIGRPIAFGIQRGQFLDASRDGELTPSVVLT